MSVNAYEETAHAARLFVRRARGALNSIIGPAPDEFDEYVAGREYARHVIPLDDSEDEEWSAVIESDHGIPPDEDQDIYQKARLRGPIREVGGKIKEKAIEAALETAGMTAIRLKQLLELAAEDSGWVSNCDAVDNFIRDLLVKYPMLKCVAPTLKDVAKAFVRGRVTAGKARAASDASTASMKSPLVLASEPKLEDAFSALKLDEETIRKSNAEQAGAGVQSPRSRPIFWAPGQDLEEVEDIEF